PAGPHRLTIATAPGDAVHVLKLLECLPAFVLLPPARAGREPDGKSFGEVLVGVLLCVPAGNVAHEAAGEGHGTIVVAGGAAEGPKQLAPLRRLPELVGVVEGVTGFVTQVHHDLARVFQIVHLALELGKLGIREVKGNPDDRLAGGTSPLVGEVASGPELAQALALQLAVELVHESLERRGIQLEAEVADRLPQDLLHFGRGFFECTQVELLKTVAQQRGEGEFCSWYLRAWVS